MQLPIEIEPKQVQPLLTAGEVVLIDCRETQEWETAKIEGAVLMPMSEWAQSASKLQGYVDKRIVVHCHHGGRSLRVTQWMRENGFPDTQNMTGGIHAWTEQVDASVPQY
ncbi:MAG: rhodanese [Pirellulaceae bacterium]|nr:rhodanese [Pirellulaceae bacterium]